MWEATRLYLASDIQTVITPQASDVYARNTDLWTSAAGVPDYAFKPLGSIWVSSTCASSELYSRVNYRLGQNEEVAPGEITLLAMPVESVDFLNEGLRENQFGETSYLDIALRLPDPRAGQDNFSRINNAELRIRWLLDENWRKQRRISSYPLNLGDNTIGRNLRYRWIRYMVPPNAREVWSRYGVAYERLIPK